MQQQQKVKKMEENLTILRRCSLFAGLSDTQTAALLQSLHPVRRSFSKGEVLLLAGYETQELGVVLCGQIEAEKQTADGVTLTLTRMGPGGIFADILAGSRGAKSPVTVTAATDVTVLLIPYKSLLRPGVPLDAAHAAVLQNLVAAMADKYFALDRRVELLMLHSLREKVLHYLRTEALPAPGGAVRTPYTRAGLAAYLGCERSALCRELSRMRRDGILQIDGRVFRLLPGVPPRQNGRCGQTGRKTMECKHSSGVTQRLARIAGQVNGIRDMVEEGRPCDDLLVQLSSASSALTQVARLIMAEHLEHCVLAGFETGDRETTVENLKKALEQFSKMK